MTAKRLAKRVARREEYITVEYENGWLLERLRREGKIGLDTDESYV